VRKGMTSNKLLFGETVQHDQEAFPSASGWLS